MIGFRMGSSWFLVLMWLSFGCVQVGSWFFRKEQQPASSDPEIHMTLEDIVRHWGFPIEPHEIKTADGYILTAFRIPFGRNETSTPTRPRPVVLFMHGLDASCICFLSNLPDKDAAYIFADNGIDVWLGNFRGNVYGRRHETLSPSDHEFWDFSWDQMAHQDTPALIDYILNVTRSQFIYYLGHSMGTTTMFALLATDPRYSRKIRRFYALGPVTTGKNLKGSARNVLAFVSTADSTVSKLGINIATFLSTSPMAKRMVKLSCGRQSAAELVCANVIFMTEGPDTGQLNKSRIPVFMSHLPSGTSWKTVAHFGQMVKSGQFRKYDFGTAQKNREKYGQDFPPSYDINTIDTPVGIYSGDKDYLAPPEDVSAIITRLRNVFADLFLYDYNHIDFIWGSRVQRDVYYPILRDIHSDFANATVGMRRN